MCFFFLIMCIFSRTSLLSVFATSVKPLSLTKPNSTSYTCHTSSPGFFYFCFNNGSNQPCLQGQKLAVQVSPPSPATSPELPPPLIASPIPSSGDGTVASSPAFPWPFQPQGSTSPSPAPSLSIGPIGPTRPIGSSKEGIPFINSNPAVPLPTGEVDSATIRPLSSYQYSKQVVRVNYHVHRALSCLILLIMII